MYLYRNLLSLHCICVALDVRGSLGVVKWEKHVEMSLTYQGATFFNFTHMSVYREQDLTPQCDW